jgi:hypothetical protein
MADSQSPLFGRLIAAKREQMDMTQSQLAHALLASEPQQVSPQSIVRWIQRIEGGDEDQKLRAGDRYRNLLDLLEMRGHDPVLQVVAEEIGEIRAQLAQLLAEVSPAGFVGPVPSELPAPPDETPVESRRPRGPRGAAEAGTRSRRRSS